MLSETRFLLAAAAVAALELGLGAAGARAEDSFYVPIPRATTPATTAPAGYPAVTQPTATTPTQPNPQTPTIPTSITPPASTTQQQQQQQQLLQQLGSALGGQRPVTADDLISRAKNQLSGEQFEAFEKAIRQLERNSSNPNEPVIDGSNVPSQIVFERAPSGAATGLSAPVPVSAGGDDAARQPASASPPAGAATAPAPPTAAAPAAAAAAPAASGAPSSSPPIAFPPPGHATE
jgi:2-oxoglutarate dehydrogenase E2 component (dihydrolipoamide succinyltransferase)